MEPQIIEFVKMQGLGNDFVLLDGIKHNLADLDLPKLAVKICDRNFGVGADGLLLVLKSDKADFRMRIFNPDGSEPQMCGNGIRCFAKYIYESGQTKKEIISVETLAGIIIPEVLVHPAIGGVRDGKVAAVEVDMGEPHLLAKEIPITIKPARNATHSVAGGQLNNLTNPNDQVIGYPLEIEGKSFAITCVNMGNPHCVIFTDNLKSVELTKIGPAIENHPLFPERTNVEFVEIVGEREIVVSVWERGVGETLACGTGACATVVAAVLNGKTGREVLVNLPGGKLQIEWSQADNHVYMTGPAVTVFEGKYLL